MLRDIVLRNIPIHYNIPKTPYVDDFSLQLAEHKPGDMRREWMGTSFLNAKYLCEFLYTSKINPSDISNYNSFPSEVFSHHEKLHSLKHYYIESLKAQGKHILDFKNYASVYEVFQKHKPVQYVNLNIVKDSLEIQNTNEVIIVEFNFFKLSWLNKTISRYRNIFKELTIKAEIHFISPQSGELIHKINLRESLQLLDKRNQDFIYVLVNESKTITEFKFILAEFNIINNSNQSFMFDTPEKYYLVKHIDFYISNDYGVLDKTLSFIKNNEIKYE